MYVSVPFECGGFRSCRCHKAIKQEGNFYRIIHCVKRNLPN